MKAFRDLKKNEFPCKFLKTIFDSYFFLISLFGRKEIIYGSTAFEMKTAQHSSNGNTPIQYGKRNSRESRARTNLPPPLPASKIQHARYLWFKITIYEEYFLEFTSRNVRLL